MSRVYAISFVDIAITAAQDLFEVVAGANNPVVPLSLQLGQLLDAGDSEEEFLNLRFRSGQTTSGSGGGTPTVGQQVDDAAESFTVERNNTTQASSGTIETKMQDVWNIRQPYMRIFTEEEQKLFKLAGGERGTFELNDTPGDSITCSGTLIVKEL